LFTFVPLHLFANKHEKKIKTTNSQTFCILISAII